MSGVDSRVVTMKFDNQQFEQGAHQTMGTIDKLKASLSFKSAEKGFSDLQGAADKFNLNSMNGSVNTVSASFSAMSAVALGALASIGAKAVETGTQLVKSLTLDPVMAGFNEYELKMGSIQTIMAGSGESLDVVNEKLKELNEYADKTIYSFADMTTNIGKFTNAGVDLDVAVEAIQGVANVAAVSGANAEEASRAMYNFAQAISTGTVRLQDWKSIELANMGTIEFKNQLIDSAVAAGMLTEGVDGVAHAMDGTTVTAENFNSTLEKQWLTSDVLIATLQRYSDTTTDIGKKATEAATQVKTFSHLMDTLRESAGSGWAETFEIIFGNFEEAVALWTKVNEVVGGMINSAADARNLKLTEWKDLGGRTALIEGVGNAFEALITIFERVGAAWNTIFPEKTGQDLMDMTVAFRDFTASLIMSEETAQHLQDTLEGVFAVFGIIWEVVKGVVGVFFDLFGATTDAAGGFLAITGTLGNFIVSIHDAITEGTLLTNFFDALGAVLAFPIELLGIIAGFVGDLFSGFNQSAADAAVGSIEKTTGVLGGLASALEGILDWLQGIFDSLAEMLGPVMDQIGTIFGEIWANIMDSMGSGQLLINLAGADLALALAGVFKKFRDVLDSFGGVTGFMDQINGILEGLTGVLEGMQNRLNAEALMRIAKAVALLSGAIFLLAMLDPAKVATATAAITTMFINLMAAMKIMTIITKGGAIRDMLKLSRAMVYLSAALYILSFAVKKMGELSWGEIARGLFGIAGGIFVLTKVVVPLSKGMKGVGKAAGQIAILSASLLLLAAAIGAMGSMEFSTIAKGLVGIAVGIAVISLAIRLMPKNITKTAADVLLLSGALLVMAAAVGAMGTMNMATIAKGLVGIAGGLVVVGLGIRLMPKNMTKVAADLLLVSVALNVMAAAVKIMGSMGWDEVAKGLITLAGSLVILSVGLKMMKGTLMGSVALLAAAAALAILVPVLVLLGALPWQFIIKSLLALAAVLAIIGLAGALLAPIVPAILAVAGAVGLLAAGIAVLATAFMIFVTALSMLVALGSAAALVMSQMLEAIIGSIPGALQAFGEGIVAFAGAIAEGGPQFVAAMTTVLNSMLQAIIDTMPKFREAMTAIVETLIEVMVEHIPDLAEAALDMILAILQELADHTYEFVTTALQIIDDFLSGIADGIPDVIDAAFDVVLAFIDGLTDAVDEHMAEIIQAGKDLAKALIRGIVEGILGGGGPIRNAIGSVVGGAKDEAESELGIASPSKVFREYGEYIAEGLAQGITSGDRMVKDSTRRLTRETIEAMIEVLRRLNDTMEAEIDLRPTITPVLDLSDFRKNAGLLGQYLPSASATGNVSYSQAAGISAAYRSGAGSSSETAGAAGGAVIRFEQNNYSPKELSAVEIYRQTKNQLSLAKEALTA